MHKWQDLFYLQNFFFFIYLTYVRVKDSVLFVCMNQTNGRQDENYLQSHCSNLWRTYDTFNTGENR